MTASPARIGKSGSRGEPEKTRAAILKAALEEFSHEGVAGARTDEIARSAGVNKALLYYYFKDKDGLYAAVLEQVFSGLYSLVNGVLDRPELAPREKLQQYAQTHFDYIASSPWYPRLVQREFMRTGYSSSSPLGRILDRHGRPVYDKLIRLIAAGSKSGEFRPGIDPAQTLTSILGTIVFYFISIPAQQLMSSGDPFARERIVERRAAVLDFISAAVFSSPGAPQGKHR
jgi:TetR/AcrR family transcriptional regulator